MNANQIAQIATALNVSPNQIKRAEEWKNVLFVVVQGKGARFVSKKVIKEMNIEMNINQFSQEVNQAFGNIFSVKTDFYGNTQDFIALDLQNNGEYHRSIKFTCEEGLSRYGMWKVEEGCFNGYGKTLNDAISQVRKMTSDCTTKAFLLPTYD